MDDKIPWIFDIKHDQYGRIGIRQSMAKGVG